MKDIFSALLFALTFLTIMPFPGRNGIRFSERAILMSPSFYPAAGLLYGFLLYGTALFVKNAGMPVEIQALFILALPYVMNKFLHFDGLCDVIDAFFADRSQEERLRILKDSALGSFALGTGILFIMLKFLVLKLFISTGELVPFLIIIPALSRYSAVLISLRANYPREEGTARHMVGRISGTVFLAATLLTTGILCAFIFFSGETYQHALIPTAASMVTMIIISLLLRLYSYKKIGGVTGDLLGAGIEITELLLIIMLLLLHGGAS